MRPLIVPIFFRLLRCPNELGEASTPPVWFLLFINIEVPLNADFTELNTLFRFCVCPKFASDFVFIW